MLGEVAENVGSILKWPVKFLKNILRILPAKAGQIAEIFMANKLRRFKFKSVPLRASAYQLVHCALFGIRSIFISELPHEIRNTGICEKATLIAPLLCTRLVDQGSADFGFLASNHTKCKRFHRTVPYFTPPQSACNAPIPSGKPAKRPSTTRRR